MRLLLLIRFSMIFAACCSGIAHGHGDHGQDHGNEGIYTEESVIHLRNHLALVVEGSVRFGPLVVTEEERQVGMALLTAVYGEVVSELLAQKRTSATTNLFRYVRSTIDSMNPVALGRWLIASAREHGVAVAIAVGLTELGENLLILHSMTHPEFLPVIPIYMTHIADATALGLVIGVPKVVRAIKLWRRHGGVLGGASKYYEFLRKQRQVLPIDWNEVIDVSRVPSTNEGAIDFAVISESVLERRLPRSLRILFAPRQLAMHETMATVAVWELEKFAAAGGTELWRFKPFKTDLRVYTAVLLRQILSSNEAADQLASLVRERDLATKNASKFQDLRQTSFEFDALEIYRSPEQLADVLRASHETPDLIAQRLLWFLQGRRDLIHIESSKQKMGILPVQAKYFRQLKKLLDQDRGLARIATMSYERATEQDIEAIVRAFNDARDKILLLEGQLPPLFRHSYCEALLTYQALTPVSDSGGR